MYNFNTWYTLSIFQSDAHGMLCCLWIGHNVVTHHSEHSAADFNKNYFHKSYTVPVSE